MQELGTAGQTKRPTSVVLVKKGDVDGYADVFEEMEKMDPTEV